jgi:hypothetical protein
LTSYSSDLHRLLARDERKRFTWPVYVAGLRARFECPAAVLVITPSRNVARWAAKRIEPGPGSSMIPFVLGPDAVPVVTDAVRAQADPELALLSVMAHGHGEVTADVLTFLDARGLSVSDHHRERILACTDVTELDRWIRRAATIVSVDELFK